MIAKIILFGPSALEPSSGGKRKGRRRVGDKWGVTSVTPGLIAWSCILARFFLSPDLEFGDEGTNTKINYIGDFYQYLYILIMERDDEHIQSVFAFFNQHIFGTTPEHGLQAPEPDSEPGEDAANNVRAALAAARARRLQPDNDEVLVPDDESVSRAAQDLTARPAPSLPSAIPIFDTSRIDQASTPLANPGPRRVVSAFAQDQASAGRSTSTPVPAAVDAAVSEDILVETAASKKKKAGSTGNAKSKKQKPVDSDGTTRKSSRNSKKV